MLKGAGTKSTPSSRRISGGKVRLNPGDEVQVQLARRRLSVPVFLDRSHCSECRPSTLCQLRGELEPVPKQTMQNGSVIVAWKSWRARESVWV